MLRQLGSMRQRLAQSAAIRRRRSLIPNQQSQLRAIVQQVDELLLRGIPDSITVSSIRCEAHQPLLCCHDILDGFNPDYGVICLFEDVVLRDHRHLQQEASFCGGEHNAIHRDWRQVSRRRQRWTQETRPPGGRHDDLFGSL